MKLGKFRRTNFGLSTALYVSIAVVSALVWNWFESTDNLLRNSCSQLASASPNADKLLLVYAEPEILKSASPTLIQLIQQINRHDPKKIAVIATGSLPDFAALNQLPNAARLAVGFKYDYLKSNLLKIRQSKFTPGFIDLHHSDQPVYRDGTTSVQGDKTKLRSLEYEIAKSAAPLSDNLPDFRYGIRFCGNANSIANIRATDLLNGNLLRELIKDKVVLIGPEYPDDFDVFTPSSDMPKMSRLELRGNMVASLIGGNYTTDLGFLSSVFLLVATAVASVQITRQTPRKWLLLAIAVSVIFPWSVIALSYWLAGVWLPGSALILSALLPVILVTLERFSKLEDYVQFWKMQSTTGEAQLHSRFEEDVWHAVGDSIYQMFQPTRVVMMELTAGATHLKRIRSIGCDYSQVGEKRLDYRRSPYWEAIEHKQPLRSDTRIFFSSKPGIREVEYMLPLVHGMTTYGIIALAMDRKVIQQWTDFDSFLTRFCSEISQLVASSRQSEQGDRLLNGALTRLSTIPEERAFSDIQNNSQKRDELSQRVHLAFDDCESALATFDFYGRVVRRNSNLNTLLQKTEISISRINFVDMIATLGQLTVSDAQQIFRDAILQNKSDRRLIANPANGKTAMMYIKPMQLSEDDSRTTIESRGLLLEIVDGQAFEQVQDWNQQLTSAMVPQALQKANQLNQRAASLHHEQSKDQTLTQLFGSVGETVTEIVAVLETCKQLSDSRISESPDKYFLLDTVTIWKSSKSKFEDTLLQRSISIKDDFCQQGELSAIANPIVLERVFGTIIEFLLGNAFDESEIRVETNVANSTDNKVEFCFTNEGGGTPVDTLRKSLEQVPEKNSNRERNKKFINLDSAFVDQLQRIDDWISQWGGELRVDNLPQCITVSLTLLTHRESTNNEPANSQSTNSESVHPSPPLNQS